VTEIPLRMPQDSHAIAPKGIPKGLKCQISSTRALIREEVRATLSALRIPLKQID